MKIELLRLNETIGTARVQKNWASLVFGIIADTFVESYDAMQASAS